jgi:uncharacterized membrane protein
VTLVRERTVPTERPPLVGEVNANFADSWCHVVSVMEPYDRIMYLIYLKIYLNTIWFISAVWAQFIIILLFLIIYNAHSIARRTNEEGHLGGLGNKLF